MIFEAINSKSYIDGKVVQGEPFEVLESLVDKYKCTIDNDIPFLFGAIGYISYDAGRMLEKLPDTSEEDFIIPDIRFVFYKNLIIFDLENNKKYVTDIDGNDERIHKILRKIHECNKIEEEIVSEKSENKFYSNYKRRL